MGEVDPDVRQRTHELAVAAMEAMDGKGLAAAADYLAAADGIDYVRSNESGVRFRVKGDRPAWIVAPHPPGTMSSLTSIVPMQTQSAVEKPVGKSQQGKRPMKNALILSPFYWQWQLGTHRDLTDDLYDLFKKHPRVNGDIVLRKNELTGKAVSFQYGYQAFEDWKKFDLIHVSTHGLMDCLPKDPSVCITSLLSGDVYDEAIFGNREHEGFEYGYFPIEKSNVGRYDQVLGPVDDDSKSKVPGVGMYKFKSGRTGAGPFVILTTRFFARTYPAKLDDKFIFLSACHSAEINDLGEALSGRETAVVGWDRKATVEEAADYASLFWRLLLKGTSVERAFKAIKDWAKGDSFHPRMAVSGVFKASLNADGELTDTGTGATLQERGETATRAIEIVSLHDPATGVELVDGGQLPIEGAPGDGKPDRVRVIFQVVGVGKDQKGADFVGSVRFGQTGAERALPMQWIPSQQVEPGTWRVEATADLGRDLDPDATYNLEPSVKLPKGGVSRWRYENLGFSFFRITVDGPQVKGQTFSLPPDQVSLLLFGDNGRLGFTPPESDRPRSQDGSGVMLLSVTFPGNEPGSYPLGRAGGGAQVRLQVEASAAAPRCTLDNGCHGVGLKPGSGSITIADIEMGKVLGDPNSSGTSRVAGSFDVTLHRTTVGLKDEQYRVRGEFRLSSE